MSVVSLKRILPRFPQAALLMYIRVRGKGGEGRLKGEVRTRIDCFKKKKKKSRCAVYIVSYMSITMGGMM